MDASSSQAREQLEATELVLRDLKVDTTPRIIVLNKADRLGEGPGAKNRAKLVSPGAMLISALDAQDVVRLRDMILDHFKKGLEVWEVLVPYSESKLESQIYAHGSVEINRHLEKGTFYRLRIEQGWARKLGLEKYRL